ncbi:hypothetical protein Bca52824_044530 [Brassica carinata]|uniref:Remorin C-terminal domain-containing protein n=1 Tax=Brassica carinata TaxID=52824 RepID=A0A8X7UPC6_BRACI|nr:hypothetical protein Bca52824_044530 [Brassica carinata]
MAEEQKTTKVDEESPAVLAPRRNQLLFRWKLRKTWRRRKFMIHHLPSKPIEEPTPKKSSSGSIDRDVKLADLEKEKKTSFIKAWEESEKTKAENKAQKKVSDVLAWENSQKAAIEAQLRKIEEKLEKKKAEYGEKMKNKVAAIHKQAEEKRAMVEAKRGEELLKAEEMAAKYRATGMVPKATCGCF